MRSEIHGRAYRRYTDLAGLRSLGTSGDTGGRAGNRCDANRNSWTGLSPVNRSSGFPLLTNISPWNLLVSAPTDKRLRFQLSPAMPPREVVSSRTPMMSEGLRVPDRCRYIVCIELLTQR